MCADMIKAGGRAHPTKTSMTLCQKKVSKMQLIWFYRSRLVAFYGLGQSAQHGFGLAGICNVMLVFRKYINKSFNHFFLFVTLEAANWQKQTQGAREADSQGFECKSHDCDVGGCHCFGLAARCGVLCRTTQFIYFAILWPFCSHSPSHLDAHMPHLPRCVWIIHSQAY